MAIHAVQKSVPTKLPEAKLHLDDVEEICNILKFPDDEWATNFVVDDKECDTLEDLKELGKRTGAFKINISAPRRSRTLNISQFRSVVDLFEYPPDEKLRWSMYARVEAVFKKRRLGIKARAPYFLAICLCAAAYVPFRHLSWHRFVLFPLGFLLGTIIAKASTLPSVVVLVYSHKTWTVRGFLEDEESRSKLVVAIVTALVTLALKVVYDKLAK